MQTYVVYFYIKLDALRNGSHLSEDFFVLDPHPIVGLLNPRDEKTTPFKIRPFEIQQDKFISFIKYANIMNSKIIEIELSERVDPDFLEELKSAIKENTPHIFKPIEYLKSNEYEIKAVTFLYDNRQYRISKYAVAEITGTREELLYLSKNSPLAYVTGIKNFPSERTEAF